MLHDHGYQREVKYDRALIFTAVALWLFGVFAVYSATRTIGGNTNVIVQLGAGAIGIVIMIFLGFFDYRQLAPLWKYIAVICAASLVLVLLAGITGIWGSKSWLKIGPLSIQPSEFVKCGFIVTFAYHVSSLGERINNISAVLLLLVHMAVPVGLVLLQPDFGTCVVFVFIFAAVLFSAGISYKIIIPAAASLVAFAPIGYMLLSEYQQKRIQVFFHPELDPRGYGYNVIQSKIALGSGGLFGNGYLEGISTQNGFLPAKHTDFIFSSVAEESGFAGSVFVLLSLFIIIFVTLRIAGRAHTLFGRYICVGVAAMLFFHSFENMGMCMGILPVTGIPLPFVSYGGSSVVSNFMAVGLVVSVGRMSRKDRLFPVARN